MTDIRYFEWLTRRVCGSGYINLLQALHSITFFSIIPRDENRAADGLCYRQMYGLHNTEDIPCTMLEMMIALSEAIEYELLDSAGERSSIDIFWDIIDNLGLSDLNDDNFFEADGRYWVERAIEKVLDRRYMRNGKGGMFPLKHSSLDQRKVEIWYQAQAYICENYLKLN